MAVQNFGSGGGGFQLSPGVNISEVDLTTVTPAVDTTAGAFAGVFRWGPVNERTLVTSENDLVAKFGKPTNINPETFFTAANFLSYSNSLQLVRAANTTAQFAAVGGEATSAVPLTLSGNVTATNTSNVVVGAGTLFNTELAVGDTIIVPTGVLGTIASIANSSQLSLASNSALNATGLAISKYSTARAALTVYNNNDYETKSAGWDNTNAQFVARWPGALGNSLRVSMCENPTQYTSSANLLAKSYTLGAGAGEGQGNTGLFNGANTGLVITVGSSIGTITLDGGPTSTGNTIGGVTYTANVANVQSIMNTLSDSYAIGDYLIVGTGQTQALKIINKATSVANAAGVGLAVGTLTLTFDQPLKLASSIATDDVVRTWEYAAQVDSAPGRSSYVTVNGNTAAHIANSSAQIDEVHLVVIDEKGEFTGNPGSVLEVWQGLSRATDAKLSDGSSNYFKTVINEQSQYMWFADDHTTAPSNTAQYVATATDPAPLTSTLSGGSDQAEDTIAFTSIAAAFDQFVSPEDVDISLVIAGRSRDGINGTQLANYLIDNIAETRKDCVVFVSPEKSDVVNTTNPDAKVVEFRNSLRSSSFAVLDSGYKQQYDKYNDLYRWIPLNGDIAGTCARTDSARDPWFSPAGTNRGQIKNSIKLAFNPNLAQRDVLYKNGVNPVVALQGQGTVLYGDKTLLAKPSAFDRINVRRLFIVLEKAISTAAKSFLFEFNDEFTRTQFRNLVEPFLRDVQGRRGIYDFKVVCDETNNTPEIVDTNKFIGGIYIKPARSINYIQLNFVAVRSGIEFSEIVG